MLRLLGAAAIAAALVTTAHAHDKFNGVYEHNNMANRLCCGGDPVTGDCEWLTSEQVVESGQGLIILSKRYGAKVFVPLGRVQWDIPRRTDGQAADPSNTFQGAWCGKPRSTAPGWPVDEANPDPNFITFCAFFSPGGV